MADEMTINIPKEVETLVLPDPSLLLEYKNMQNRIIYMDFDVGVNAYELCKQITRWNLEDLGTSIEDRKIIKLYLMNYGGSSDIMLHIYDTIKLSKTPVYGYNLGACASAGFWIFIACDKRYMFKNATCLIHDGEVTLANSGSKAMDNAKAYKQMVGSLQSIVLENTEIPKSTLTKKWKDEWSLTSEECFKYKICDEIVTDIDVMFQ